MSADGSGSNMFRNLAYFQLDAYYERGVVKIFVKKMKDGEAGRTVFFKNAAYDTENPLDNGVPVIRRMTEEELERHRKTREPRPNLAAEMARDDTAVSQLSSDVQRYLRDLKRPLLLRDFAKLMMERDEDYFKQTKARLSDRDLQTLTPDEIRERCLGTLSKLSEAAPFGHSDTTRTPYGVRVYVSLSEASRWVGVGTADLWAGAFPLPPFR